MRLPFATTLVSCSHTMKADRVDVLCRVTGRELVSDAGRAHGVLLPLNPLPDLSGSRLD